MKFSIIPPTPGMKALYHCTQCSKSFWATIPIFKYLGLGLKCPQCGSQQVCLDNRVSY